MRKIWIKYGDNTSLVELKNTKLTAYIKDSAAVKFAALAGRAGDLVLTHPSLQCPDNPLGELDDEKEVGLLGDLGLTKKDAINVLVKCVPGKLLSFF